MFTTPAKLLSALGKQELCDIVSGKYSLGLLTPDLLALVINGGDVNHYSAEELTEAASAVSKITDVVSAANSLFDANLQVVGYQLPINQVAIDASPLTDAANKVCKYELMQIADEDARKRYEDVLSLLKQYRKSELILNSPKVADVVPPVSSGFKVGRSGSQFDWDAFEP